MSVKTASRSSALRRIALWIVLITAPSTLLTGYAVYKAREYAEVHWQTQISQTVYQLVLLVAMVVVVWISARTPLVEIKQLSKREGASIE